MFFYLLTCTYGHPVTGFISSHNMSHHRYTQSRKDVFRTTKVQYRWNFLNYILFYSDIAPQILKNDLKYLNAQRKLGRPIFWQFIREFIVLLAYQGVLLYLNWKLFLLFVFIPHTCAKLGIVNISILQHDGCDENSKYNGSRNFVGSIFNFFLYNNGYHTIHHVKFEFF
jgi:fatty acid desaturase